uniref:Uncharacterized protein n=1 Tax=Arundo donax TaxID=35708 RepID=A0A0A9FP92_ARUDO
MEPSELHLILDVGHVLLTRPCYPHPTTPPSSSSSSKMC